MEEAQSLARHHKELAEHLTEKADKLEGSVLDLRQQLESAEKANRRLNNNIVKYQEQL